MKRVSLLLSLLAAASLPMVAAAGDFHVGANLACADCHVTHYSQSHGFTVGGTTFPPLGASGPYKHLLRNEVNDMCLACHDGQAWAPDVFGTAADGSTRRLAGALNAAAGHRGNDGGYETIDGHTLWSTDVAPGGTFAGTAPEGLNCVSCHAQHGIATQYRNLLNRNAFTGKNVTYAVTVNDGTKDVYERSAAAYNEADVDFNEPDPTKSAYAAWCQSCHTKFHGASGSADMGGASGGDANLAFPWLRHPQADVNIGQNATFISSLSQFNSHTNRVKVMDSQGLWNGTTADNTVTPSCFSCHKAHGNKNAFGLIFMTGTGTVTEEGDGGIYKDLCRQCHVQGG
jgi:hypothetical protein